MEERELIQKVYEISNCEFPLDSFLNDVLRNTNPRFNKEMALRDIEKICDTFNEFRKENAELKEKSKEYDALLKEIKVRKLAARTKYIANPSVNTLQEYKNYRDLSLKKNWITEKKNNK